MLGQSRGSLAVITADQETTSLETEQGQLGLKGALKEVQERKGPHVEKN